MGRIGDSPHCKKEHNSIGGTEVLVRSEPPNAELVGMAMVALTIP
jgi:hypothetical protein